jgi:hypothetical protein
MGDSGHSTTGAARDAIVSAVLARSSETRRDPNIAREREDIEQKRVCNHD